MPRTRIVLVEPDGYGGLAHVAYQLANALADAGADVTLLTSRHYELAHLTHRCRLSASLPMWPNVRLASPPRWIPDSALAAGRRIRRLARAIRLLLVWAHMTRRLRRERPDVVQFSAIRFPILGLFLRSLRRAGVVLTQVCHEYEPRESGRLGQALVRHSSRWLYSSFSMIFFVGRGVRESFLATFAIDPARTRAIALGPALVLKTNAERGDLRSRYGIAPGAPVALFFGGLRPSKGIEDLVAAFEGVVRAVPGARLLIVGAPQAGVRPAEYREQVRAAGLAESIILDTRYVPFEEVGPVVRTADVLVLPYRSATSSAVLQVAYTFARPVVVTAVGALAEAVADGETGFVVPPGSGGHLTAALVRLLSDRARAEEMGREARRRFAHPDAWSAIASDVLTATEAALMAAPDRRRRNP